MRVYLPCPRLVTTIPGKDDTDSTSEGTCAQWSLLGWRVASQYLSSGPLFSLSSCLSISSASGLVLVLGYMLSKLLRVTKVQRLVAGLYGFMIKS